MEKKIVAGKFPINVPMRKTPAIKDALSKCPLDALNVVESVTVSGI
jgi:ferredoxin